jgi:hypothetical protein
MTINGQLLLLVVATGLFVRIWGANDQSRSRSVTRPHTAVAWRLEEESATTVPAVMHQPVSVNVLATGTGEEIWTRDNCPIPLPAGITGGSYRVIDDTGCVARLELAAADAEILEEILREILGTTPREVHADFHMTSVGSRRWYFIRLQTPVAVDVRDRTQTAVGNAVPENESSPWPFLNRKFDFTGYVTSERLDGSASDEIARPQSPELPVSR